MPCISARPLVWWCTCTSAADRSSAPRLACRYASAVPGGRQSAVRARGHARALSRWREDASGVSRRLPLPCIQSAKHHLGRRRRTGAGRVHQGLARGVCARVCVRARVGVRACVRVCGRVCERASRTRAGGRGAQLLLPFAARTAAGADPTEACEPFVEASESAEPARGPADHERVRCGPAPAGPIDCCDAER
eukprot:6292674-Prymnesium_polylepis.1